MKKFTKLFLLALLTFSVIGCGKKDEVEEGQSSKIMKEENIC